MGGSSSNWYDDYWLKAYYKALSYLEGSSHQESFRNALDVFRVPDSFVEINLPSLFSPPEIESMKVLIDNLKDEDLESHELFHFGRMVVHDHEHFSQLQSQITERISDTLGEEVEPSYNFLSLYNNLGICAPHMDAPVAKWTVDFCIEQSAPWPIYVSDVVAWPEPDQLETSIQGLNDAMTFNEHITRPGDTLIFGGSSQWHYRNRIPRHTEENFCNLIFFHFIPKGCKDLAHPERWAEVFSIPGLKEAIQDS